MDEGWVAVHGFQTILLLGQYVFKIIIIMIILDFKSKQAKTDAKVNLLVSSLMDKEDITTKENKDDFDEAKLLGIS